jgi:hypothetical protein
MQCCGAVLGAGAEVPGAEHFWRCRVPSYTRQSVPAPSTQIFMKLVASREVSRNFFFSQWKTFFKKWKNFSQNARIFPKKKCKNFYKKMQEFFQKMQEFFQKMQEFF